MTGRWPAGGLRGGRVPYDEAQARIEANERVCGVRWAALEFRLNRIEEALERLERRLWLTVYGVAAAVLAQLAVTLLPGAAL